MAGPYLQGSMPSCQPSNESCASCPIVKAFHLNQIQGFQEILNNEALRKEVFRHALVELRYHGVDTLETFEVIDQAIQQANIDTFDCEKGTFLAWFKTIITRIVLREKKAIHKTIVFLEDTFSNPGKGLERTADLNMLLTDALNLYLKKNERRTNAERDLSLFLMRHYEGYTAQEIAEQMDLTRQRVTRIINEVGEALRELIDT